MSKTGFENIKIEDMNIKPTKDTIGTAIGYRNIDGTNLIAVVIRGGKYESEWASNVIGGKSGNAKGLDETSQKVINRISQYISDNNLTNNKIWITGYSRAGAVADLAGVYINQNLDKFSTTEDNLFVYAFEAPNCSSDTKIYDNIYCTVNQNDIITFVYPEKWGLYKNGKVISLGNEQTITAYDLYSEVGTVKTNEFLAEFADWFGTVRTREEYSEILEQPISEILNIYFSKSAEEQAKIIALFKNDILSDFSKDFGMQLELLSWLSNITQHDSDSVYHQIADDIVQILQKYKNTENAKALTAEEFQKLEDSVYPLIKGIAPYLAADYVYYDGIDYEKYYAAQVPLYHATDFEWGYAEGSEKGFSVGYKDGLSDGSEKKEVYNGRYENDFDEYKKGFDKGYSDSYSEAFELGRTHITDFSARGAYDGKNTADGYSDGVNGNPRNPVCQDFNKESWMTEEYINAFNEAYAAEYNKNYDKGVSEKDQQPENITTKPLYHVMSFFKNISNIIPNHYPLNIIPEVYQKDSYYNGIEPITDTDAEKKERQMGDVNGDKSIDSADALLVLRFSVGLEELTPEQKNVSDTNGDSVVDSADALLILRHSIEL